MFILHLVLGLWLLFPKIVLEIFIMILFLIFLSALYCYFHGRFWTVSK